jgi:hypothetical protein
MKMEMCEALYKWRCCFACWDEAYVTAKNLSSYVYNTLFHMCLVMGTWRISKPNALGKYNCFLWKYELDIPEQSFACRILILKLSFKEITVFFVRIRK